MNEDNEHKMDSELDEEERLYEPEVYEAELKDIKVYIADESNKSLHDKGYYGNMSDNVLVLEPIEALLLLERGRLIVNNQDGEEFDFRKLSEHYVGEIKNFWIKFLVYKDLRSRGYIVRPGFGEDIEFRVYDRGAVIGEDTAKYLIHPVMEGSPLKLTNLAKITKIAKSSRKKLVLTVVDRQGEVTYYQCKEVLF